MAFAAGFGQGEAYRYGEGDRGHGDRAAAAAAPPLAAQAEAVSPGVGEGVESGHGEDLAEGDVVHGGAVAAPEHEGVVREVPEEWLAPPARCRLPLEEAPRRTGRQTAGHQTAPFPPAADAAAAAVEA